MIIGFGHQKAVARVPLPSNTSRQNIAFPRISPNSTFEADAEEEQKGASIFPQQQPAVAAEKSS